jgi:hypothetical protein
MSVKSIFRPLCLGVFLVGLVACRETTQTARCDQVRIWSDTLGTKAERERIELQWARVGGSWDSLMASREGKAKQERAAGSLDANALRYMDSLEGEDGSAGFRSGCVDWNATWATSDFDRMALATAMARVATADTGAMGIGLDMDTASRPRWVQVDLLNGGGGDGGRTRSVRFRLDSLRAQPDSTAG